MLMFYDQPQGKILVNTTPIGVETDLVLAHVLDDRRKIMPANGLDSVLTKLTFWDFHMRIYHPSGISVQSLIHIGL